MTQKKVGEYSAKQHPKVGGKFVTILQIPTKKELIKKYVNDNLTTRECGKWFNVSYGTILRWLKFYKIKRDTKSKRWQQIEVKCDYCKKKIWKKRCHINKFKLSFCNRECHGKWKSENLVGEDSPSFTRIKTACANCGKEMYRKKGEFEKPKNFFCCPKCNGEWKAKNLIKDKVYNWKGGYEPYYGDNWKRQRALAWRRDNYTCMRCGKKEIETKRNPDVHHIVPFRVYGIEKYREANKLDNLICYCNSCHKIIEEQQEKLI